MNAYGVCAPTERDPVGCGRYLGPGRWTCSTLWDPFGSAGSPADAHTARPHTSQARRHDTCSSDTGRPPSVWSSSPRLQRCLLYPRMFALLGGNITSRYSPQIKEYMTGTFLMTKWAHTPLAEKRELLVAVLGVPAVQTSFIHAFDLKALQLGTEDVVLGGRRLPKIGQILRWQKHLHRPCRGKKNSFQALQQSSYRTVVCFLDLPHTFVCYLPATLQGVVLIGDHILVAHPKPGKQTEK